MIDVRWVIYMILMSDSLSIGDVKDKELESIFS